MGEERMGENRTSPTRPYACTFVIPHPSIDMLTWRYIADDNVTASFGLAADEVLMRGYHGEEGAQKPPTLHLYTYRSHAALVGRFQNVEAELNLDECERLGIAVNRRPTGGGAILMGEDQLGIALVASRRHIDVPQHPQEIFETFATGITMGLRGWGIKARFRLKNDIEVHGRKVAGLALCLDDDDALLFHASVLVDLDTDLMLRVLNLTPEKISDKAVATFEERLTTIRREGERMIPRLSPTAAQTRERIRVGFQQAFGIHLEPQPFTAAELEQIAALEASKYRTRQWVYQRAPASDTVGVSVTKTAGGLLRVYVALTGDVLKRVLITGDFSSTARMLADIEAALTWSRADRQVIERVIDKVYPSAGRGEAIIGVSAAALADVIWQAIEDAQRGNGEIKDALESSKVKFNSSIPPAPHPSSPDYVQMSLASAMLLRLRSGRFYRDARPRCVNLLLTYRQACLANCAYCGLAREHPVPPALTLPMPSRAKWGGEGGDQLSPACNSFIRVEWPVASTQEVAQRLQRYQAEVARVCLSMVTHGRAVADTLTILRSLKAAVPAIPFSTLIAPNMMDEVEMQALEATGVDMVGIGLDAASERVFERRRGTGVGGPLAWAQYWRVVDTARALFGPFRVNCHLIVGLGETDAEMVDTLFRLRRMEVGAYLFCFYPEAGTLMQRARRPSLVRWRRLQLTKHLIDTSALAPEQVEYDARGRIAHLRVAPEVLTRAINSGTTFMTHGCPDKEGALACNRPFGSYRPGEPFRDYPFPPTADDIAAIMRELRMATLSPSGR